MLDLANTCYIVLELDDESGTVIVRQVLDKIYIERDVNVLWKKGETYLVSEFDHALYESMNRSVKKSKLEFTKFKHGGEDFCCMLIPISSNVVGVLLAKNPESYHSHLIAQVVMYLNCMSPAYSAGILNRISRHHRLRKNQR